MQLTNVSLHVTAMKETKITAQDAVLSVLILKLNFRVVNNSNSKLSWLGCLSAFGNLLFSYTPYKGVHLDLNWGPNSRVVRCDLAAFQLSALELLRHMRWDMTRGGCGGHCRGWDRSTLRQRGNSHLVIKETYEHFKTYMTKNISGAGTGGTHLLRLNAETSVTLEGLTGG